MPPYPPQTDDNPDGPLPREQADQMTEALTSDRDGFFEQFDVRPARQRAAAKRV